MFHWHLKFYKTKSPSPSPPTPIYHLFFFSANITFFQDASSDNSWFFCNIQITPNLVFLPSYVSWIYPFLSIPTAVTLPQPITFCLHYYDHSLDPSIQLLYYSLRFFSKGKVWWGHFMALNSSMAPHCSHIKLELVDMVASRSFVSWCYCLTRYPLSATPCPTSRLWPHLSALQWCHMFFCLWCLHRLPPTPETLPSILLHCLWSG